MTRARLMIGAAFLCALGFAGVVAGPEDPAPPVVEESGTTLPLRRAALRPLPHEIEVDPSRVALGRRLFYDGRLSADGTVSCATCHSLTTGGADRVPLSSGIGGILGRRNVPTVFNASFNFRQFWDGRAATLLDQVKAPVEHPGEMGHSWVRVVETLEGDSVYRHEMEAIYADGVTAKNAQDALAEFVRSLVTPDSPFDRFLRGDQDALDDQAMRGYARFLDLGCVSCHQGIGIGGNLFQQFGLFGTSRRGADLGRFEITGDPRDRHAFKVPSLRNVAVTPPYLHDGSVATLAEVVTIMIEHQAGREPLPADVAAVVSFLESLTGEYEGRPLR